MGSERSDRNRLLRRAQKSLLNQVWTTRRGEKVRVGDMSESHIVYTFRMLIRLANKGIEDDMGGVASFSSRVSGEEASRSLDNELSRLAEMDAEDYAREHYPAFDAISQRYYEIMYNGGPKWDGAM